MYLYDASAVQTINAVNQYHGVIGFSEGSCTDGTTFLASSTGAITNTANNGGVLRCTDATHGLTTGQYVTLNGMGDSAHVGTTRVTVIDTDTFDCDNITYNSAADTGSWQRGSSITVNTGYQGNYDVSLTTSYLSAGALKDYKFEIVKNATHIDEIAFERKIGTASDLGSASAGGILSLAAGDTVWIVIEGTSDTTNATLVHANMHFSKI
jgi:hypothetical protein